MPDLRRVGVVEFLEYGQGVAVGSTGARAAGAVTAGATVTARIDGVLTIIAIGGVWAAPTTKPREEGDLMREVVIRKLDKIETTDACPWVEC